MTNLVKQETFDRPVNSLQGEIDIIKAEIALARVRREYANKEERELINEQLKQFRKEHKALVELRARNSMSVRRKTKHDLAIILG